MDTSRKTTIISTYAGPGAGKSTSAAYLYAKLKQEGVNAELVREYVKDWAWEGRTIGQFDQILFLGKQAHRETMLFGKVDVIVTDCPVWLIAFYAEKHSSPFIHQGAEALVRAYYEQVRIDGHRHIHIWVNRSKPYNPDGRYQDEAAAKQLDADLRPFLEKRGIGLIETDSSFNSLDRLLKELELV